MSLSFRQQEITEIARRDGRVTVDELVQHFDVTPQTIRKDLNELCERKILSRVHGGAVIGSGVTNLGYEQRRDLASREKTLIGRMCAEQIPHSTSLFINLGTTTEAVARALLHHRDLLVITNNLNVANILIDNPGCEVIIAGGALRRSYRGIIGEATVGFVNQFKVDYAVIGTSAIDPDGSLLDFDYREVRVAQAILENARRSYLVADKSKLERSAPVRIGHISQVSDFFTDEMVSSDLAQVCGQAGVQVHETRRWRIESPAAD